MILKFMSMIGLALIVSTFLGIIIWGEDYDDGEIADTDTIGGSDSGCLFGWLREWFAEDEEEV